MLNDLNHDGWDMVENLFSCRPACALKAAAYYSPREP